MQPIQLNYDHGLLLALVSVMTLEGLHGFPALA
jgi:hypothetical protein